MLLNARLIELRGENKVSGQPSINDFNEFLEEIVVNFCEPSSKGKSSPRTDAYGKSIPLTAIPFEQIAVVYPIAHIGSLMRRAEQQKIRPHRFLTSTRARSSTCCGRSCGNGDCGPPSYEPL